MHGEENWLEKYKPKKLCEVMGDETQIKFIDKFIKQFAKKKINIDKIKNPNLIISGTNGIGKTLITDLVLKENGFEKITADLSNVSIARKTKRKKKTDSKETNGSQRTIKTFYMSLLNKNILELETNGHARKKIALVFDNVSNISNPKEKDAIKSIVKLNNKLKKFPIIIITGTKHSKTVNELRKMLTYYVLTTNTAGKKIKKKYENEVVLRAPSYRDIELFVKNICTKEKLKILQQKSDDDDIYGELISHSQYDIRWLVYILEDLKKIYKDSDVTLEKFKKYQETSKTKDLDPGIFEATGMLLDRYTSVSDALTIYGEERATMPLMVHENYLYNIKQQYPRLSYEDQIDMIYNISESISLSDKVDGLIYSNQCWNLQPVHGFYSCVMPSYYINKKPGKIRKAVSYQYTQDFNKTSIKKINNKVIKKSQENHFLKHVSIYDFLYMASILNKIMYERKDLDKTAELMVPYKLKLKSIESITKIDKIKKSKNTLTGKQRSYLKKLLGDDDK